jgi:hypothetical protein
VTLTVHNVAMIRAEEAAKRLDAYMASQRGTGVLKEFNRAFKRRRMEAMSKGRGFMNYKAAELRLRRALIPLLMNGGKPAVGQSLFASIFGAWSPSEFREGCPLVDSGALSHPGDLCVDASLNPRQPDRKLTSVREAITCARHPIASEFYAPSPSTWSRGCASGRTTMEAR